MKSKQEAFSIAQAKTQEVGGEYRVVEVDGQFVVGVARRINFFYPEALGWNFYPIY